MKNKVLMALLSLAMAFSMWLYVIYTVSPGSKETYYNIPVVFAGESVLAERGLMVTAVSSSTVTLELSGNRTDLSKVDANTITLKADLTSIYDPGSRIPVSYTTAFPGNVASNAFVIESKNPSRIYLTVERKVSKSVPIEIRWTGSPAEGFLADRENRVQELDTVQITGPQSVVDKIDKAIVDIDLTDQRESISQSFPITLSDSEGEPLDVSLVTANADAVHVDVRIQRVRDLQLSCLLIEGGGATSENAEVTLSVDTIRISGSEAALEQLGEHLVIGVINLAEITEDCERQFPIQLEEGISNLTGVSEVTVSIRLHDLATRDFLVSDITAINVPEGRKAELFTREMTVHVRGAQELVEALTPEQIHITVDFTGAEAGISTFRAHVSFDAGFESLGTIQDESVSASVESAEKAAPAEETKP